MFPDGDRGSWCQEDSRENSERKWAVVCSECAMRAPVKELCYESSEALISRINWMPVNSAKSGHLAMDAPRVIDQDDIDIQTLP